MRGSSALTCVLLLLSCSSNGAPVPAPAPEPERSERPMLQQNAAEEPRPRFEALLWRHEGPPLSQDFADALRRSGLTGVCVDQDEDPARVRELGLRFYLDHAAGKGILHLRPEPYRDVFERYQASRSALDLARPHPLAREDTREQLRGLVRERVARAAPQGPIAISLDDEISTTRLANPLDFCFAPESLEAFRDWLQRRYGTLERLGEVWGRPFEHWQDVLPPTTDEVRVRELYDRRWPQNLADWNDHRAFMDEQLADVLADLATLSRSLAPGVPVGFEGGQAPSAFGGFDYARLLRHIDFVEPYDIGGTRELVRSLAAPGTRRFETIFPAGENEPAAMSVARLYDALAHGLSGVIVWSSGLFFSGEDPTYLSAYGERLTAELPRVTGPSAAELAGATVYDGAIAILESHESVRLHWMLDSRGDRQTWLRRFGSYERTHSTSQAARLSWIRLLQDGGYAFRFVTPAQLASGDFGSGPAPRVLVLPSALALGERTLRAVTAFASRGGLVIADEVPGRYDEHLRLRVLSPLDEFFGVTRAGDERHLVEGRCREDAPRIESGLALIESGLRPIGLTAHDRSGEDACQLERPFGTGKAVLLNLEVSGYHALRLRADETSFSQARDLRRRIRGLLEGHGIYPVALASVPGYPSILERVLLGRGPRKILVVRPNCLENPALFAELLERGEQPMQLLLPVPARVTELWTGKVLGTGDRVPVTLDPLRGSFFVLEAL